MSHSMFEQITSDFTCPLAGTNVQIRRDYTVLFTGSGKHRGKKLTQTDCSHKDSCVIATRQNDQIDYDWSKCVFLHPAET